MAEEERLLGEQRKVEDTSTKHRASSNLYRRSHRQLHNNQFSRVPTAVDTIFEGCRGVCD